MFTYFFTTCIIWDCIIFTILKNTYKNLKIYQTIIYSILIVTIFRCLFNVCRYGYRPMIIVTQLLIFLVIYAVILYKKAIKSNKFYKKCEKQIRAYEKAVRQNKHLKSLKVSKNLKKGDTV